MTDNRQTALVEFEPRAYVSIKNVSIKKGKFICSTASALIRSAYSGPISSCKYLKNEKH